MWWLRRLSLALVAFALSAGLPACGFQPVYGGGAAGGAQQSQVVAAELAQVAIPAVPDRVGHRLRAELQRLLASHSAESRYRLDIRLDSRTSVVALDRDESDRRRNLRLVAEFTLTPIGAEKPVFRDRLVSDAGIDQLPSDFATLVAEDAGERRAVERLARDIRQRLALYFRARR